MIYKPCYPCRMGCRCRITWVLWLLPLDSPSSSFTIMRSPEDTTTSAPAITLPHRAARTEGRARMLTSRWHTHTCMHWCYLMHRQVNESLSQHTFLACNCHRNESMLGFKRHNPHIGRPCLICAVEDVHDYSRGWEKSLNSSLNPGL